MVNRINRKNKLINTVAKKLQKELIHSKQREINLTHLSGSSLNITYLSTGIISDSKLHKPSIKRSKKLFENTKITSYSSQGSYFFSLTSNSFYFVLYY